MAKWGKCDFKQLKDFQKKIEKLAQGDEVRFLEECAKELAARLLSKVINRTLPGQNQYEIEEVNGVKKQKVVKNGGTLRRGWTAKTHEEAEEGNGSGKDPEVWANSLPIKKVGDTYEIEVVNPVHYASYVEYGHRQEPGRFVPAIGKRLKNSWVPGKFMLTISEKELESEIPGVLEKKINEFLKECF